MEDGSKVNYIKILEIASQMILEFEYHYVMMQPFFVLD